MIDFLIIGGGIAGVSAAARIAPLGSVTLLEAEDALSYHASGRSSATFEPNYGAGPTLALNSASCGYHLQAEVLGARGLLMIGTAETADDFTVDQEQFGLNPITVAEARDMIPILKDGVIDRAAYHTDAFDIDTDKLLQSFARTARENGAQITTNAKVTAITRIKTGWEVETKTTSYFVKNIVNAAGAWVDVIAEMAGIIPIGVTPLRRSMARIPAPGDHDVSKWPMLFGAGETWYAKPDAGALIVSPAEEDPLEPCDAHTDDITLAEGLARYETHVSEPVARLLTSWAGLRTFAPDRTLVLGPDPADANFFWCAGQGGYGMQTSPAASQLLADLIAGTEPDIPAKEVAALSPARFRKPLVLVKS